MRSFAFLLTACFAIIACGTPPAVADETAPTTQPSPPAIGEQARDFALPSIRGNVVKESDLTEGGPLVLIVLRGWPGYQCPICTRQFGSFLSKQQEFADRGARVVFVYPGPAEQLNEHASEFTGTVTLPDHFDLLLDPDYVFTQAYGLRWDAPKETAYPSTFVIDSAGVVRFAKISHGHGDRTTADEVLAALPE